MTGSASNKQTFTVYNFYKYEEEVMFKIFLYVVIFCYINGTKVTFPTNYLIILLIAIYILIINLCFSYTYADCTFFLND